MGDHGRMTPAFVGFGFPVAERTVDRIRPRTPEIRVGVFRAQTGASFVIDRRSVAFVAVAIEARGVPPLGTGSVVGEEQDKRVVELSGLLELLFGDSYYSQYDKEDEEEEDEEDRQAAKKRKERLKKHVYSLIDLSLSSI